MTEFEGDRRARLSGPLEGAVRATELAATGATQYLHEGWQRPVRHNRNLERLALWHTVRLDAICQGALDVNQRLLMTLGPSEADAETRYQVRAAMDEIPRLVPFTDFGRSRLRTPTGKSLSDWGEDMVKRDPDLVAQWHNWIWRQASDALDPANDYGPASELVVATSNLSGALRMMLGGEPLF